MRREFGIAREEKEAKTLVGAATRGRMKKDLNDLSRFSYFHFPPLRHAHIHISIMASMRKRDRGKGRKAKARVSEPLAEGGMSFSAVFNGGARVAHNSCSLRW